MNLLQDRSVNPIWSFEPVKNKFRLDTPQHVGQLKFYKKSDAQCWEL